MTADDTPVLLPVGWQAPSHVRAFVTTRQGGVSSGAWGMADGRPGGLNLGARCGDDPLAVRENRLRLARHLPGMPVWLQQVHGVDVCTADRLEPAVEPDGPDGHGEAGEAVADAAITQRRGQPLVILTADCLAVFFTDYGGRAVGLAHAGWRGLAAGVLEQTLRRLHARLPGARWQAHLGPAIGRSAFEVGDDVRQTFLMGRPDAAAAFVPTGMAGKWWCDLPLLARQQLQRAGIERITGGDQCTVLDPQRFYSHRRDRVTGRMASVVWLA